MDEQRLRKILKEELKNVTTKTDLKKMQDHLEDYIFDVFSSADKRKAEKSDVDELKKKVKHIEEKVFPN